MSYEREPLGYVFDCWNRVVQYDLEEWASGKEPLDEKRFTKLIKDTVDNMYVLLPVRSNGSLKQWREALCLFEYLTIYGHYATTSNDKNVTVAFDASKLVALEIYNKLAGRGFQAPGLSKYEVQIDQLNSDPHWRVVYDVNACDLSPVIQALKI